MLKKYDTFQIPVEQKNYIPITLKQDIQSALNECLFTNSRLPNVICEIITSYLPIQYQFMRFNPFNYNRKYSIMAFILIMINNLLHYILITFMCIHHTITIAPSIVFVCICIAETFCILYTYKHDYQRNIYYEYMKQCDLSHDHDANKISLTEMLSHTIITFNNKIQGIVQLLIYIPMTVIIFFFNTDFGFMTIYCILYLTVSTYQCYMYRQINVRVANGPNIFALIYVQLNALIVMIYGIIYSSSIFFAISTFIVYAGFYLFLRFAEPLSFERHSEYTSICGFTFICIENLCFAVFSWQLFNENNEELYALKIASMVFTITGLVIITVFYYYYYDPNQYFDFWKFYCYLNGCNDIIVHFAMISVLFYYCSIPTVPHYFVSWYLAVIIIVLREFYRAIWMFYKCAQDSNWAAVLIEQLISFFVKFGIITFVFGLFILNGGVSTLFIVIGSSIWCLLILFSQLPSSCLR